MEKPDFDTLVRKYGKKVFNIAYRITGNRHDAEDATQEAFLQVHRGLDRFRGDSEVFTWIYRIVINASLNTKRRRDKGYFDSVEDAIVRFKDEIPEDVREWETDPEKRYLFEELLEEIRRACYQFITFHLTDEQQVTYILRVLLNFSLDDISAILQVDKNTVKARLQRAKVKLGSYFSGRCQWLEGKAECSCRSRLGFGIAFSPDILKRLRNRPMDNRMKATVRSSLGKVRNFQDIYRSLPIQEYDTYELEKHLKKTLHEPVA